MPQREVLVLCRTSTDFDRSRQSGGLKHCSSFHCRHECHRHLIEPPPCAARPALRMSASGLLMLAVPAEHGRQGSDRPMLFRSSTSARHRYGRLEGVRCHSREETRPWMARARRIVDETFVHRCAGRRARGIFPTTRHCKRVCELRRPRRMQQTVRIVFGLKSLFGRFFLGSTAAHAGQAA